MKLVRDGIPMLVAERGDNARFKRLDSSERIPYLKRKLLEEAQEVNDCLCLEELADVLEVIHGLLDGMSRSSGTYYTMEKLEKVRIGKQLARGGFEAGYVLLDPIPSYEERQGEDSI